MLAKFIGYTLAISAVFLWSFNIIYSKILTPYLSPVQISFIRWTLAAMFLLPFTAKDLWVQRVLLAKNFRYIVILSLTGLGIVNFCVYHAGHTANAIDMALIDTLSPVFIILLSHFFGRETIGLRTACGILLALGGVVILILHGDFSHLRHFKFVTGDLWMLAAATLFALYSLTQKKISPQLSSLTVLCAASSVTMLLFLPPFLTEWNGEVLRNLPDEVIAILLILGFLNSGAAYFFWSLAIKRIGLVRTGAIYYLMPVFSSVSAYFILDDKLYGSQVYGAVLVFLGILLVVLRQNGADGSKKK